MMFDSITHSVLYDHLLEKHDFDARDLEGMDEAAMWRLHDRDHDQSRRWALDGEIVG